MAKKKLPSMENAYLKTERIITDLVKGYTIQYDYDWISIFGCNTDEDVFI